MSEYHFLTIVSYIRQYVRMEMYVIINCIFKHVLCENMFHFFIKTFIKNNYIHPLTCIVVWGSLVVSAPACRKSTVRFSAGTPADSLLRYNVEDNGTNLRK